MEYQAGVQFVHFGKSVRALEWWSDKHSGQRSSRFETTYISGMETTNVRMRAHGLADPVLACKCRRESRRPHRFSPPPEGHEERSAPRTAAREQLVRVLLAEDDDDDYLLTVEALRHNQFADELMRVSDGEELLHYLRHSGAYRNPEQSPTPSLVLLDLNMPRKDGREALQEIKSDPKLRHIPIVVLTTSRAEEDIIRSYQLGVNSFIKKPVTFQGLVDAMGALRRYWFEVVALPS